MSTFVFDAAERAPLRGVARVAEADRVAQRVVDVDVLAQRSQRLLTSGTGADRRHVVEAGTGLADLPTAGRQLTPPARRIDESVRYGREHFEDPREIPDWKWTT